MQTLRITGGASLKGAIPISGAKNAALPLMCASLLLDGTLTLSNVPYLADVVTMARLLGQHGVQMSTRAEGGGHVFALNASAVNQFTAPYELVRTMRASVLVLGPLLARFGEAKVSLPGGCAIGTRPIDLHLFALEAMGAEITLEDGYVVARVNGRLRGAEITFDKISVGATENAVMAATLADGVTVLRNAAQEPEVQDLCHCLNAMGAKIEGIGTAKLTITGVTSLNSAQHRVIADRIEAGSFLAAAAMTGGEIELIGAELAHLGSVVTKFEDAGVHIQQTGRGLKASHGSGRMRGIDIMTEPYPAFPTDMQAQFMALLSKADGASMITETIFENRYMHAPELTRMGANITIHGSSAMIRGVERLRGAEVMATDLRASISLVIAALAAEGETTIHRIYHLDRGYERLEEKLQAVGAQIERIGGDAPRKIGLAA